MAIKSSPRQSIKSFSVSTMYLDMCLVKHSGSLLVLGLLEMFKGTTDSYSYSLRLTRISPLSVVGQGSLYNGLAGLKCSSLDTKGEHYRF